MFHSSSLALNVEYCFVWLPVIPDCMCDVLLDSHLYLSVWCYRLW